MYNNIVPRQNYYFRTLRASLLEPIISKCLSKLGELNIERGENHLWKHKFIIYQYSSLLLLLLNYYSFITLLLFILLFSLVFTIKHKAIIYY